jgi:hypothetical protein
MDKPTVMERLVLGTHARKVSAELPGAWSVDFALGENGIWYLIDMALAKDSWHPADCPHERLGKG